MACEVNLQSLGGQYVKTATIAKWHKKEGDTVNKGDIILTAETAKVSVEIEAPASGIIQKIFFGDDTDVDINETIAIIAEQGEEIEIKTKPAEGDAENQKTDEDTAKDAKQETGKKRVKASPIAKRLAKENNIDLSKIKASEPNGRIRKEDVLKYIENAQNVQDESEAKQPAKGKKIIPVRGRRKAIAKKMSKSYSNIPHVTITTEVRIDRLKEIRTYLKKNYADAKISFTDLLAFFVCKALQEYSYINAKYVGDEIIILDNINIGVAVDVEEGLIVPVVKNCEDKSLFDISNDLKQLINKSREGKIAPDDLVDGTFTITNLGTYGIKFFTPIINEPETAILGVGNAEQKVFVENDQIVTKNFLPLSLSFDHRAVDGGPAAKFLNRLKELIENPFLVIFNK